MENKAIAIKTAKNKMMEGMTRLSKEIGWDTRI